MKKIIISVIGQDRPGIVAALSDALHTLDCNIENVSQTILQSVFGAILIVAAPEEIADETIKASLDQAVAHLSLEVIITRFPVMTSAAPSPEKGDPFVITTTGPDRKGLVAETTKVLADHGVNITNLKAVFKGGDDPFQNLMIYEVTVPGHVVLADLHRDLKAAASRLGLDINIQHRHIFETMSRI
jgi:glycine cleavage system transcriptional repressor